MYSVVAGQRQSGGGGGRQARAQHKEQNVGETSRNRGFREKLIEYVKRKLNPQPEEELENYTMLPPRHRPEPPATLAATSRFTQQEIKLMYRGFKQECPSGVVDEEAFKNIFCQFFPLGDASQYAHLVFNSIKNKQQGRMNFEEFLSLVSIAGRGSLQEQLSWVFALYDLDGDGRISRAELLAVVSAVYRLLGTADPPARQRDAEDHTDRIFNSMDADRDGWVTPEELARWCRRSRAARRSLRQLDTVL